MGQDDALTRFKDLLREASAKGDSTRPADLRAADDLLDQAAACIDGIDEPRRRDQARLFVGVRRADLLFRADNAAKAGPAALAARAAARAAGVWEGPYQETGLLLLWQCLPRREFVALVEAAPEDLALLEGRAPASEPNALPLRLLRADLLAWRGDEAAALREWTAVSARLREGSASSPTVGLDDAWADKCHDALVWHLVERREYERAAVYAGFLREESLHKNYAAILANQRGDHTVTVAMLEGTRDPRLLLLLGDALEQLGRFDEAKVAYQQALAGARDDRELRAAASNGLGDCHRRANPSDPARAATLYEESLALLAGLTTRKGLAELAENHKDLGLLAEAEGDGAAAHANYRRALAALERARADLALDPFGQTFLEPQFLAAVDGALRTAGAVDLRPLEVMALLESVKARSLLDRVTVPPGQEPSADLVAAVRRLARARDATEAAAERLEVERLRALQAQRPDGHGHPFAMAGLRELARLAPVVFVSYWIGEDEGWLVWSRGHSSSGGRAGVVSLGPAPALRAHIRAAWLAVATPDGASWAALDPAAEALLPAAVRDELPAGARVVVCPDEETGRVPFEALRIDGEPLGVRCAVERAPSLTVWARLRDRVGAWGIAGPVVVVDSVATSAAAAAELGVDPLRFSAAEGDLVAAAWPQAHRVRGADATLAGVTRALGTTPTGLLHLSAHALVRGAVPSESLLLLADGGVPLPALAEWPLAGATVVLSACSSGVGAARGGEGDASLLWGPLGAGARCVIASVWQVNQQATCDLMGQVHHWLARGIDEAESLRRARRTLMESPNYAHPHYWAGFAAFGARELDASVGRRAWAIVFLVLAGVSGLGLVWYWRRR